MNGIVYKQWYSTRNDHDTPKHNVQHLKYIATRPGAVQNPGCGFGLWGRTGKDDQSKNIDNLKLAMAQIRRVSKEHTVYRAIVSLDEDTAIQKGFQGREEWQELLTAHAETIAKQNSIDLPDFRWCASYHHERGHPHVHIMFWDNSDRVHDEYMGNERFEIAAEKIRAAFNGDIFKEELKGLRSEMDAAKRELRILSRNNVAGFSGLSFFSSNPPPEQNADARFYPRDLKPKDIDSICQRLDELVSLLPKAGQLKYQYLEPNVKAAVDAVSQIVLEHTSLKSARAAVINSIREISKTYGNSDKSVQWQIERAGKEILKDVGNDVLKTVKSLGWLDRHADHPGEYGPIAHERMLKVADEVLSDKMNNAEFLEAYNKFVDRMPLFLTPMHEVLTDDVLAEALRELTLGCMNDPRLKLETKISQAFENMHDRNRAEEEHGNEGFKAVYRQVNQRLYDMAANAKGWDLQAGFLKANNFLRVFCRLASPHSSINNANGRFLLLRELSRQAKKERGVELKGSGHMWDAQL